MSFAHSLPLPILKKYYQFDKIFDLLEYDQNLSDLYAELKSLTRESYPNNYRFIFLHYDTDYYITNNQPGILLRNLQRIVHNLDISNYFCLILTQQDIQAELDQLAIEETRDRVSIAVITHLLQDCNYLPRTAQDLNPDCITRHYMCLNRVGRTHRRMMFSWLKHNNLLDKGFVSYGHRQSDVDTSKSVY